jgi:hypothetical protein
MPDHEPPLAEAGDDRGHGGRSASLLSGILDEHHFSLIDHGDLRIGGAEIDPDHGRSSSHDRWCLARKLRGRLELAHPSNRRGLWWKCRTKGRRSLQHRVLRPRRCCQGGLLHGASFSGLVDEGDQLLEGLCCWLEQVDPNPSEASFGLGGGDPEHFAEQGDRGAVGR